MHAEALSPLSQVYFGACMKQQKQIKRTKAARGDTKRRHTAARKKQEKEKETGSKLRLNSSKRLPSTPS